MLTITCPICKYLLNQEGKVPEVFPSFTCPNCSWSGMLSKCDYCFKGDFVIDEEEGDQMALVWDNTESDEEVQYCGEENEESEIMATASHCAETQVCSFLKTIIKEFDKHKIQVADLPVLAKMHMVLTDLNRYTVSGYLYLTVKDFGKPSMTHYDIHIDSDGLQLTHGVSYLDTYGCYEQETRTVFPFENEYEAVDVDDKISEFIDTVRNLLLSETMDVEAVDSGDPIEDND